MGWLPEHAAEGLPLPPSACALPVGDFALVGFLTGSLPCREPWRIDRCGTEGLRPLPSRNSGTCEGLLVWTHARGCLMPLEEQQQGSNERVIKARTWRHGRSNYT